MLKTLSIFPVSTAIIAETARKRIKFFIPPAFLYSKIPDWTHEKQEAIKHTCTNVSILTIKPYIHFDIRYMLNEGSFTAGSFFNIEHI